MKVVLYLHMHQPWRLARFRALDLGSGRPYFDVPRNLAIFRGIAERCYRPALVRLAQALDEVPGFKFSLSITGTFLEQARQAAPDLLPTLRALVRTGRVSIAGESYYHSLSFLLPPPDLADEVKLHSETIAREFDYPPQVLRMTELAYSDDLARFGETQGFKGMLAEGWEGWLGGAPANYVYRSAPAPSLAVLLRNYRLSDDVGFRFSSKEWVEYPLLAPKYANWLADSPGDVIGLFLDFETFGEHHAASTGILDFLSALPHEVVRHPNLEWATVDEAVSLPVHGTLSAPNVITWADQNRDLGAWLGNDLQKSAFQAAKKVGTLVRMGGDPALLETWRKLFTSDHFYYMYVGGHGADLGVHQYFSAYGSPYDAYANYMNALTDLRQRAVGVGRA